MKVIFSSVLLGYFCLLYEAIPAEIISPDTNSNSGHSGPFILPSGSTIRYQQVYGTSDFESLPVGGGMITAVQFFQRNGGLISVGISSLQINLSTTSRGPDGLSAVFSENVGANDTIVVGPRAVTFGPEPLPAFGFRLDRPFLYDPSAGNLLMDVRNFAGGVGFMMGDLEVANYVGDSTSAVSGGVASQTGLVRTDGLITLFTITPVPEPASVLVFLTGGLLVAWSLHRRR